MRRRVRGGSWLQGHWLEAILLAVLVLLVGWFASVGVGFVPRPTPTPPPAPTPTPDLRRPAGGRGVSATSTPRSATATPLPTATLRPASTATGVASAPPTRSVGAAFDGQAAYQHVLAQTKIGPRPAGSPANQQTQAYITGKLTEAGWQVETQDFTYMGTRCRNLIARAGKGPVVILGAHYDTRRLADNDPDANKRSQPVMGANDGASGVALLLELARTVDKSKLNNEVWLAFFDAEDNGRLDGWDFIAGSRYMAANLGQVKPAYVVVVDMIGDADQQIHKEQNSTTALQDRIWQIAGSLGYGDYFKPDFKYTMLDDHTPFLERGLPAQDLIDFDYPYWHTVQDTADKVSAASLEHVGRVLQVLLEQATS